MIYFHTKYYKQSAIFPKQVLLIVFLHICVSSLSQNVGINSTGDSPNSSAMLDITSGTDNNKGILIPRMTNAQRLAIATLPAAAQGLLVYQTDGSQGFYYNTSATTTPTWVQLVPGGWSITGNSGTNASTDFLGTTDAVDLVFRTSSAEKFRINNSTNQLLANNSGSASQPIYSFNGNTNTGIFRPGTNQLGFSTNGSEWMSLSSTGLLGLNQTAPTQRLEVHNGNILLSNSGTAGELQFQATGSAFISSFKATAQSANINYVLPTQQSPSPNLALVNDGSGNLSWNIPSLGNSFAYSRDNFEDFVFDAYAGAGTNDNQYSFTRFTNGTGSSSDVDGTVAAAGNDYFGIHILNTGTTTTGRAGIGAHNNVNRLMLGGRQVIYETRVRVETLSDATNSFTSYYGFMDGNAAGVPGNGMYFSYNHGVNSGNWTCTAKAAGTTSINSSVAVVANQWYILRMVINATGTSADFYIDDVLVATANSNIPTGSGRQVRMVFKIEKSAGTAARTTSIDFVGMRMNR